MFEEDRKKYDGRNTTLVRPQELIGNIGYHAHRAMKRNSDLPASSEVPRVAARLVVASALSAACKTSNGSVGSAVLSEYTTDANAPRRTHRSPPRTLGRAFELRGN
jgi:hypothetical protein